jgi:hypothetical protein
LKAYRGELSGRASLLGGHANHHFAEQTDVSVEPLFRDEKPSDVIVTPILLEQSRAQLLIVGSVPLDTNDGIGAPHAGRANSGDLDISNTDAASPIAVMRRKCLPSGSGNPVKGELSTSVTCVQIEGLDSLLRTGHRRCRAGAREKRRSP